MPPVTRYTMKTTSDMHSGSVLISGPPDGECVMARDYDAIAEKLRREEEDHAQLQSRCFEGFPSASDGVFDALAQAVTALRAAEQCIGELPPTQARVETMQMIQAALPTAK